MMQMNDVGLWVIMGARKDLVDDGLGICLGDSLKKITFIGLSLGTIIMIFCRLKISVELQPNQIGYLGDFEKPLRIVIYQMFQ